MTDQSQEVPTEQVDTTDAAPHVPEETTAPDTGGDEPSFAERFDPNALAPELQEPYRNMRGDYTRKTQDLARQRKEAESAIAFVSSLSDPDKQASALQQLAKDIGPDAVLEALGYEIDQPDEDVPFEDDPEFHDPRVDQLIQEREQARETQEQARIYEAIDAHVESAYSEVEKEEGRPLTERDKQQILNQAITSEPDENGMPNIVLAYQEVAAYRAELQKGWIESKRTPSPPQSGTPGTPAVDSSSEAARVQRMAEVIDAARAA